MGEREQWVLSEMESLDGETNEGYKDWIILFVYSFIPLYMMLQSWRHALNIAQKKCHHDYLYDMWRWWWNEMDNYTLKAWCQCFFVVSSGPLGTLHLTESIIWVNTESNNKHVYTTKKNMSIIPMSITNIKITLTAT